MATDLTATVRTVTDALDALDDEGLPMPNWMSADELTGSVQLQITRIRVDAVRAVAEWARHYGTELALRLVAGGSLTTTVDLDGVQARIVAYLDTTDLFHIGQALELAIDRDTTEITIKPDQVERVVEAVPVA